MPLAFGIKNADEVSTGTSFRSPKSQSEPVKICTLREIGLRLAQAVLHHRNHHDDTIPASCAVCFHGRVHTSFRGDLDSS